MATPATTPGTSARTGAAARVLGVPHRFFFLAGVCALALASIWWTWVILARAWPAVPEPPSATLDSTLHALLMTCGFAPLFMFGFVFTAGPRWLGLPPPSPAAWRPGGVLAAAGALALVPLQVADADLIALRIAAAIAAIGWLLLVARFFRMIRASDAPDKVHAALVAAALAVGASSPLAFALLGPVAHAWIRATAVWCFLLPVFVAVCHRMIPFFTSGVAPFVTAFRPWWLLIALVAGPVAHAALEAAGLDAWTWCVDLPTAALTLWLTFRWGLMQSLANRLLAMLHLGFVWYGVGFLLAGASSLSILAGGSGLGLAPLHALTIGFAASLLLAMVTRVTCGHSGRTLAADAVTWRLFQLLQAAALLRVAAEVLAGPAVLAAAALAWSACFVPWAAKYAPVYWRRRADGREG
jgi:uncharacterized protein involved in response to NO